jgi:hypothetical protein
MTSSKKPDFNEIIANLATSGKALKKCVEEESKLEERFNKALFAKGIVKGRSARPGHIARVPPRILPMGTEAEGVDLNALSTQWGEAVERTEVARQDHARNMKAEQDARREIGA